MRLVVHILDFYINASIHVAFAAVSLCLVTLLNYQLPFDWYLLCFVFFATITGYNFVKYFGLAKFHHRSLADWLKTIQVFSFFCFVAMCYFATRLHSESLIFLGVLGLITFFYAIPFLPRRILLDHHKNLRSIGGLKVFVIAFVWTAVTVVLPFLESDQVENHDLWLYIAQRFVLVLVLMLPFEIRDLQYDSLKLATIPQQIGVNATKLLGEVLVITFLTIHMVMNLKFNDLVVIVIIAVLLLLLILFSKKDQSSYFCSFFVEGIPILYAVLTLAS